MAIDGCLCRKQESCCYSHPYSRVNTKDQIHVRRTFIDKMRGVGIEAKTQAVMGKWKAICDKKNKELDEADAMSTRLWKGEGGQISGKF